MHSYKILWLAAFLSLFTTLSFARTWTDVRGRTIEGSFLRYENGKVSLRLSDGKEVVVRLRTLSKPDQTFVREKARSQLSKPRVNARDPRKEKEIHDALEQLIAKEQIPGMIAAITDADGVVAIACSGVRKNGSSKNLAENDIVHLGSCTKAMTSTMLATLAKEIKLNEETTLIEVFPELKDEIHPDYHRATLLQLITHTSGMPANAKDWWSHRDMEIKARRLEILKDNLKEAPPVTPGTHQYSNLGYMVAGSMAERLTGQTWETLIKKRLFEPLGMESAGFGPPGTRHKTDQPWGHVKSDGEWQPKQFDNAQALGPAGRVHCTVEDWGKFVALQLPQPKPPILARETLNKLIVPIGDYACGWIVTQRSWAEGLALTHSGSNTMWYATVWIAPKLNRAYIAVTNSSADDSNAICDKMIAKLISIDRQGH